MKIRIISKGESNAWILGKISRKLKDELIKINITADIADTPDPTADINHHMLYLDYNIAEATGKDTLMITHIDNREKLEKIKKQLEHAQLGICMSAETMQILSDYGIPSSKLSYINPAHDGVIISKKIIIGIATAVYADGRKREQLLLKIADKINPANFIFKIMGSGWENIVIHLKEKGFQIEYYDQFDYDKYVALVPLFDYYLYLGLDEGSMGFVDALSAGVKTIVTPQGYHMDAKDGITHSFNSANELGEVFNKIAEEQNKLKNAVKTWTWRDYAVKHAELWKYLTQHEKTQSVYPDGLNTLINKPELHTSAWNKFKSRYKIFKLTFNRFMTSKDKLGKIKRKLKK